MQVVKNNKGVAIGIGIAAAAGGGVAYVIHSVKARKTEQLEECAVDFRKSIKAYLKATKN